MFVGVRRRQSDFWDGFFNVSQDSETARICHHKSNAEEMDKRVWRRVSHCILPIKISGRVLNVAVAFKKRKKKKGWEVEADRRKAKPRREFVICLMGKWKPSARVLLPPHLLPILKCSLQLNLFAAPPCWSVVPSIFSSLVMNTSMFG